MRYAILIAAIACFIGGWYNPVHFFLCLLLLAVYWVMVVQDREDMQSDEDIMQQEYNNRHYSPK